MIEIINGITRHPDFRMKKPVHLRIENNEQIAIIGSNGSGKSRLVDIIIGRYPLLQNEVHYEFKNSPYKLASENIKYISFRDSYGDTDSTYYYQQRWNQHDIDESTPTVGKLIQDALDIAICHTGYGLDSAQKEQAVLRRNKLKATLYEIFHIDSLLDKYIISLSSGELRKFQLTKTLIGAPRVLILDNPFIGLDQQTRAQLSDLLRTLIHETDLQIILVQSKTDELPDYITHVIPVEELVVLPKTDRQTFLKTRFLPQNGQLSKEKAQFITQLPERPEAHLASLQSNEIVKCNQVHIRYGNRHILNALDWTVRCGEKWALYGENGAGKSTLLSLICADNPQSYACDIELFGRKRGTGESIWEIKRHIGYVSPEMHRAYLKDIPAIDIVASGLSDSVGLYVRPRLEQRYICEQWMNVFGILHLKDRTFLKLSSGEQRLCLLARAFVKDPELLILDEPLHGLDNTNRQLVREIINTFALRKDKTIIMVTHYMEELPNCITQHLRLKKG